MDSARARRPFRYLDDNDSDPAEFIDEQGQEKIIDDLTSKDKSATALYRKLFLSLPLFGLSYIIVAALLPTGAGATLSHYPGFCICCAISHLLSFWSIYSLPKSMNSATNYLPPHVENLIDFIAFTDSSRRVHEKGLLLMTRCAPGLNAIVCAFLVFLFWREGRMSTANTGAPLRWSVLPPLFISLATAVARRELRPVDVEGLSRLRYPYKGA